MPFENTPDDRFLYRSDQHAEALSRLSYLLHEKKPCGVFVGMYGCGKTLILHALQHEFASQGYTFSVLTNPRISDLDMLRLIINGFTKGEVPAGKGDALMALERIIHEINHDGKHPVVVVDEAHAIENEKVFEELRLLLNYQSETKSLITLILCGQPELKNKVESNKQLNQRVSIKSAIGPLSRENVHNYIQHRLHMAGASQNVIFEPEAMDAIYNVSGGIPRWINNICHMSLLNAFMNSQRQVDPALVKSTVSSMDQSAG